MPTREQAMSEAMPADSGGASASRPGHMLSFDVEEYFQVEAAAARLPAGDWERWPSRVEPVIHQALQLLDEHRAKATFFILDWIAQRRPEIVRRVAEAGHEVASHGVSHRMLHVMTPRSSARNSRTAAAVWRTSAGSRSSDFGPRTFSVTTRTSWALDVLAETGFRYDSSVFPIRHDRYGVPDAPMGPLGPRAGRGRIIESRRWSLGSPGGTSPSAAEAT